MPATIEHVEKVLAYCNAYGESETLKKFGIKKDTHERYQRRKRFWDTKQPKVLLIDIETTPMQVHTWGTWKQRIKFLITGRVQYNDVFITSDKAKEIADYINSNIENHGKEEKS